MRIQVKQDARGPHAWTWRIVVNEGTGVRVVMGPGEHSRWMDLKKCVADAERQLALVPENAERWLDADQVVF